MTLLRKIVFSGVAFGAIVIASCGAPAETRKPTFPVNGKVLAPDGKPAELATIIFHPVGDESPDAIRPRGRVSADGTFKLTSYDGNDGAPAGEYRVTVEQWIVDPKRPDEPAANRLSSRYSKPDTSGLTATVSSGPTELQPYELKR